MSYFGSWGFNKDWQIRQSTVSLEWLYKDWHFQRPTLLDNIGFTFIYIKMCEIQITIKIYKCGNHIEQDRIREECTNLGNKNCLGLCKVPIGSWLIKMHSRLSIRITDKAKDMIWLKGATKKLFKLARHSYVSVYFTSLDLWKFTFYVNSCNPLATSWQSHYSSVTTLWDFCGTFVGLL